MKKHVAILSALTILAIAGTGVAASAFTANAAPKINNDVQVKPITDGAASTAPVIELIQSSSSDVIFGLENDIKKVEIQGDGKAYTFDEFKQWLEDAKLEAEQLVKSGAWTQEQADQRLAPYRSAIAEIEEAGGKVFVQLVDKGEHVFSEKIENFYKPDELIFELPAKLADSVDGEVGFTLGIRPKR